MKTEEDEAFEAIERRQGGFQAKRAMAADKLQEDRIKYGTSWEKDGERIDPMSVYKKPVTEREALKLALDAQSYAVACLLNQLSTKDKRAYAMEKLSASIAAIEKALAQPAQEPVAHSVIAGALFDFMGWLTLRKERIVLSSADNAAPAADAIKDFAKMRDLSLYNAQVETWQEALAQPAQKPVAFICQGNLYMAEDVDKYCTATHIPLYTAAQPAQEPVAYVTGMSFGRFIVEPLNPAMVLPVGMALYSAPQGNT